MEGAGKGAEGVSQMHYEPVLRFIFEAHANICECENIIKLP